MHQGTHFPANIEGAAHPTSRFVTALPLNPLENLTKRLGEPAAIGLNCAADLSPPDSVPRKAVDHGRDTFTCQQSNIGGFRCRVLKWAEIQPVIACSALARAHAWGKHGKLGRRVMARSARTAPYLERGGVGGRRAAFPPVKIVTNAGNPRVSKTAVTRESPASRGEYISFC